jgi:UDP-N-acetylmuramate--alanine ligase
LYPQDGKGVTDQVDRLVGSTAVEDSVPDYAAAKQKNIPVVHRAELLSGFFNQASVRIGVAGTSGKSTTTGMIGWLLHRLQMEPTIINGAAMRNFMGPSNPYASFTVGSAGLFVAETDESDGSIERFNPTIAVLNNIAFDHKTMDELRVLFRSFVEKATRSVLNLDNKETEALALLLPKDKVFSYSLKDPNADFFATNLFFRASGVSFDVVREGKTYRCSLHVPGEHNVSNALASLAAVCAAGGDMAQATEALSSFAGIARRMEVVGEANDITVIDDFAHNPDKIAATLRALHRFEGRLLILFQPHGYGPLRLMRKELAACFKESLSGDDRLYMCDPLYLGGTTDKSVGSADVVADIEARGQRAFYIPEREDCVADILRIARGGDRIIVMGARDDTLSDLARDILLKIESF